jgi:uncharacterized protein (UPF0264 family)
VPGLLVSVRSAAEAHAAVAGGASVVDVKEPARGPLGRAPADTWREVRAAVPRTLPVSVALGELRELEAAERLAPSAWSGLAYRKVGLSGVAADPRWADRFLALRAALGPGPAWIAVAYADHRRAGAPHPEDVLDVALETGCAGLLVDTFSKTTTSPLAPTREWAGLVARARAGGLRVALAGGLDEAGVQALAPLQPDLFAVRGAACAGGSRGGAIDADRVAALVAAARLSPPSGP